MATGSSIKSDLYKIYGIVQNTMLSYPRELIIEVLRESFSLDSYYHFVRDEWGFPKIKDHTNLSSSAGMHDDIVSRIFIGDSFKKDMKFYPAVLVKSGGSKYVPISATQNLGYVQYVDTLVLDGYGNKKIYATPSHYVLSGAWEGQITIDIFAGDISARDEITQIVSMLLTSVHFRQLVEAGVIIKPISISSPSEIDDINGKIYKTTINCDIRTEWERNIPIASTIDAINFCTDFGDLSNNTPIIAPNLSISTTVDLLSEIQNL